SRPSSTATASWQGSDELTGKEHPQRTQRTQRKNYRVGEEQTLRGHSRGCIYSLTTNQTLHLCDLCVLCGYSSLFRSSTVDEREHFLGVASAGDFADGEQCFDAREIVGGEFDAERAQVFLQALALACAWNGNRDRAL